MERGLLLASGTGWHSSCVCSRNLREFIWYGDCSWSPGSVRMAQQARQHLQARLGLGLILGSTLATACGGRTPSEAEGDNASQLAAASMVEAPSSAPLPSAASTVQGPRSKEGGVEGTLYLETSPL